MSCGFTWCLGELDCFRIFSGQIGLVRFDALFGDAFLAEEVVEGGVGRGVFGHVFEVFGQAFHFFALEEGHAVEFALNFEEEEDAALDRDIVNLMVAFINAEAKAVTDAHATGQSVFQVVSKITALFAKFLVFGALDFGHVFFVPFKEGASGNADFGGDVVAGVAFGTEFDELLDFVGAVHGFCLCGAEEVRKRAAVLELAARHSGGKRHRRLAFECEGCSACLCSYLFFTVTGN